MNLTQMHERLRKLLLHRIERGSLSVSLLARQTGFGRAHLSNFLRARRNLSFEAMDRILDAQHIQIRDLVLMDVRMPRISFGQESNKVPVVSHRVAISEPLIRTKTQSLLEMPATYLRWRTRPAHGRKTWDRFVAITASRDDVRPMEPAIPVGAFLVLDRHWNSLTRYRPERENIYAVRFGSRLVLRHVDYQLDCLILRPHNHSFKIELLAVPPNHSPNDFIVGRVALILHEL